MRGELSLNGKWGLTYAEGAMQVQPEHFLGTHLEGRRLMEATVPAPIHKVLMDAGIVDDPNFGLNSLKARWVEEQFWIYRHKFNAPPEATDKPAWLVFDRIETSAVLYLNGEEVGRHANAHRPARFNVTGKLKGGENLIVMQVTTGMHEAGDKPGKDYFCHPIDMLTKRPWHRKPQYQCGWDWNPRLMNVGILGNAKLEWSGVPRLDQTSVYAMLNDDLSEATLHVRAAVEGVSEQEQEGTLKIRVTDTGQEETVKAQIVQGENCLEAAIKIDQPKLWWPINHGEQNLYTVGITLQAGGEEQSATRKTGIRKVEIDQPPHPEEGKYFLLKVNDRPIFCKGGNWVPADMMYSTVTPERYKKLVDLAVEANFNLLRIWGGGLFTDHALCEACDEAGILIWHDFLFACAKYPGDVPEFVNEVRTEVRQAVRELSHHPSLVVWCGNNEIEWGDWAWGYDDTYRTHPHYALFHRDLPKIVHDEDPSKAYWLSSPYSPDYKHPNDPTVGDQHPWQVAILVQGGTDGWKYRELVDRFPNEGGVLGASTPATLRQFLPEDHQYLLSPSWEHHDNPFAVMDSEQGNMGHAYATVSLWTDRDPFQMEWRDYAFCSGLLQAEGLQEYILNYRRRMFSSSAAIFWMYNDSWPVTHGWTIVDYYLRKKLSYHPVRRAFSPITVIAVEEGDDVVIYGVNDTPKDWSGEARWGLFKLAGDLPMDERQEVTLPANASTELVRFARTPWTDLGYANSGIFALLYEGERPIAQHRLFVERFGKLNFAPEPEISMQRKGNILKLESPTFAWGVCLDENGDLPVADNCFDLIPGIPYEIPWDDNCGEPKIDRIGNRDCTPPGELPG